MVLHGKTVRLVGERDENLQCLSKLSVGDARVYRDETDGNYYLKDPTFDGTMGDQEVQSKAEVILKALNEYAKARCDDFQPVEIGPVCTFESGERKITHFFAPVGSSRADMGSGKSVQDAQDALNSMNIKKILEGQKRDRKTQKIFFVIPIVISIISVYFRNITLLIISVVILIIIVVILIIIALLV